MIYECFQVYVYHVYVSAYQGNRQPKLILMLNTWQVTRHCQPKVPSVRSMPGCLGNNCLPLVVQISVTLDTSLLEEWQSDNWGDIGTRRFTSNRDPLQNIIIIKCVMSTRNAVHDARMFSSAWAPVKINRNLFKYK